ncbi:hypothetical protein SERLADRAFT_461138 [Serpula lacrymans var. lacrymans S7.9]|nr:uncharacterized protein SERLADRAFT_461138 [Serpula lacrymans var. lacrymans S7.9]EGO27525.1 hypothetical protein SERLADRAFT_461138 [Serpula lacrymans var. lacrymans S7.9]
MPTKFNIFRSCIYGAVLLWTIICLAIAAHFQSLLVTDDLTRFVPFSLFVCSASLLIIVILLTVGIKPDRNPISTRIELGCLGLLGTFWIALGGFLAGSDSAESDVECFASDTLADPIQYPGFSTETYQAQYRVLEAFSLFNAILIWGFFLLLLVLAVRHYRNVNRRVWYTSVTAYPWFGKGSQLPGPATRRSRSKSRGRAYDEKNVSGPNRYPSTRRGHGDASYVVWQPERQGHKVPARAHTVDKYKRNASPRR